MEYFNKNVMDFIEENELLIKQGLLGKVGYMAQVALTDSDFKKAMMAIHYLVKRPLFFFTRNLGDRGYKVTIGPGYMKDYPIFEYFVYINPELPEMKRYFENRLSDVHDIPDEIKKFMVDTLRKGDSGEYNFLQR